MQAMAAERVVQDKKQREADLQDAQNQEVSRKYKQDFNVLTQPLLKESMSDVAFLCLPHASLLCSTRAKLPTLGLPVAALTVSGLQRAVEAKSLCMCRFSTGYRAWRLT